MSGREIVDRVIERLEELARRLDDVYREAARADPGTLRAVMGLQKLVRNAWWDWRFTVKECIDRGDCSVRLHRHGGGVRAGIEMEFLLGGFDVDDRASVSEVLERARRFLLENALWMAAATARGLHEELTEAASAVEPRAPSVAAMLRELAEEVLEDLLEVQPPRA